MGAKSHISKTIASSWLSLVVVSACQLIMIPVALGALDKVDFALFAVITQMMMAIRLAEMGVSSACARLLIDARAKGDEKFAKVWMASVCIYCIQAIVMLTLVFAFVPFLSTIFHLEPEQQNLAQSLFLVVGGINAIGYALSVFSTAMYAGQRLSYVNMVSGLAAIIQVIVFTLAIKQGAQLWAYPISMIVISVFTHSLLITQALRYKLVGRFDLSLLQWLEVKTVFRLGMDVFVAAIFSVVMGNSLLLFSGHLLTLEQTAMLAVNLKLVNMMTNILQRIPGSASPMLMKMVSEGNETQFKMWWMFLTKMTISVALACAGMFVIWNKLVVTWWTSDEMVLGSGAVMLLALVPFRYLIHYQFVNSLTIFKEIRKVKWLLVWEIVLYAGLAYWLGKQFGLVGLLSANLLSMFGGALFYGLRWFSFYSKIRIKNLLVLLIRLIGPLVTAFIIIKYISSFVENQGLIYSLTMSLLWGGVFAVITYCIILDTNDRRQLKQFVLSARRGLKTA